MPRKGMELSVEPPTADQDPDTTVYTAKLVIEYDSSAVLVMRQLQDASTKMHIEASYGIVAKHLSEDEMVSRVCSRAILYRIVPCTAEYAMTFPLYCCSHVTRERRSSTSHTVNQFPGW